MNSTSSLKIAIVTETWRPEINGVALTIGKIADGLLEAGCTLQLFRPRQAEDCRHKQIYEYLTTGFTLPFYKAVRVGLPAGGSMRTVWSTSRPDVVVVVTEGPLGYSAIKAASSLGIPVISEFHTHFEKYSKFYHLGMLKNIALKYLRRFHNRADLTLVPTRELKKQLDQKGFKHLAVLARGIDSGLFNPRYRSANMRKQWGLKQDHLAVIYVGRIAAEKNLPLAIRAFRSIQQKRLDARFILVGDGPLRDRLEKENPDFIFCGMQTGTALAKHYASADLFLMPSTSETFGNTLLEAMSSGLGVVAYDYAAAAQHVQRSENGLKVPLDDESAFIEAAVTLAVDDQYRSKLALQARNTVLVNSWHSIIRQYLSLINELIAQKPEAGKYHDPITASPQSD